MADKQHKDLFENLGKPTLRGVRKCPKCGTYNGTRGLSCKNKDCKLIFKTGKEKKKPYPEIDAVKIISPSPLQIYSVKLNDSKDDNRCFVHLPLIEGIEALQDEAEVTVIKQSAATCYAVGCTKPVGDTGTLHLNLNPCSHTYSVVNCLLEAEPLVLKKVVMKAIPISEELREDIFSLVSKPDEHLVQRVTKNTMVVKCVADDLYPLGYVHFSVYETLKNTKKFRVLCSCQTKITKPFVPKEKQMCIHFYMSICAFASDNRLLEEFRPLIQSIIPLKSPADLSLESHELESEMNDLRDFFIDDIYPSAKRKKSAIGSTNAEHFLNNKEVAKIIKKEKESSLKQESFSSVEENMAYFTFEHWLASVTERINQTMHYQFNGCPDPLVFQVPQVFFEILHKRLAVGSKKKRLPNSVVGFSNKDTYPIGVFSRYTWHFTNILHVKRIFDTSLLPLEITRSFIENRDGTYVPYQPLKDEEDLAQNFRKTLNNLLIKPLELKTFLKVGNTAPDQKQPTPFIIEWIPDILPRTQMGELTIKFQYGHQRNGIVEHRNEVLSVTNNRTSTVTPKRKC